jgi:hypothetical protein
VGLGTWKADGNREDKDIVLLRREISTSMIRQLWALRRYLNARLTPPKMMVARD